MEEEKKGGARKGKSKQTFVTDVGMADFYKFYLKKNFKGRVNKKSKYYVSRKVFGQVVDTVNKKIRDKVVEEIKDIKLPYLGFLTVRKYQEIPKLRTDGKIMFHSPVDWNATYAMWKSNPKTKEQKKVFKFQNDHTENFIYKIRISSGITHRHLRHYQFCACRLMKQQLRDRIKRGGFDAFIAANNESGRRI